MAGREAPRGGLSDIIVGGAENQRRGERGQSGSALSRQVSSCMVGIFDPSPKRERLARGRRSPR